LLVRVQWADFHDFEIKVGFEKVKLNIAYLENIKIFCYNKYNNIYDWRNL